VLQDLKIFFFFFVGLQRVEGTVIGERVDMVHYYYKRLVCTGKEIEREMQSLVGLWDLFEVVVDGGGIN